MSRLESIFTDIANAIRRNAITSLSYTPSDMASAINDIRTVVPPYTYNADSSISVYSGNEGYVLDYAFAGCSNLTEVSFPACKYIGPHAFRNTKLSEAIFPECEYIGGTAFGNCYQLSRAAFAKCSRIESGAFDNCYSITEATFPECELIGANAFSSCTHLTEASFPECSYIGYKAFVGCNTLSDVYLPMLSSVATYAFQYCYSLFSIALPACKSIAQGAFYLCSSFHTLNLLGIDTVPYLSPSSVFYGTQLASGIGSIYIPASLYDGFVAHSVWASLSARFVSF